jgi:hypothetical protein
MKKIITIIIIIGLVIGFFYAKNWWNEQQAFKARLAAENIKLRENIQEDSLTISTQVFTIYENEQDIINKSKNIKDLEKKYNTTLYSYIHLQTQLDSLSADQDTTVVDSTDSTLSFRETFGKKWFEISGKINREPLFLYALSLQQLQDIIFEITLEKLPGNEEYVSFVYTNVPFINLKSTPVKVLDKRRWIDKISIMGTISLGKFGAGAAFFYDEFGIGYNQYIDSGAITLNYLKNLGSIF